MAKLLAYPYSNALVENFQANDMKFAFVNRLDDNTFQPIHAFVKCREYFNEILMANHHPDFEFIRTYGLDYKKDEFPLDLSATRIAIKFPSAEKKEMFMKNLNWLHTIEDANNTDHTQVFNIEGDGYAVIVEASKLWIQKCLLTNLYTLVLKLMSIDDMKTTNMSKLLTYTEKGATPSEVNYLSSLSPNVVNNFLANCTVIADTPSKYVDGSDELRPCGVVHGNSGVMTFQQYYNINQKGRSFTNALETLYNTVKSFFEQPAKIAFVKDV